jgi:hypothetical protein
MKRIEKTGEVIVKIITLPIRICIGLYKSVEAAMPESIEIPIEIRRKEEKNGNQSTD